MNIVIADCYHDSDKGGCGILAGTIRAISKACPLEEQNLSLIYRFSEDDPRFKSSYRLTHKTFPHAKILPSPISTRRGPCFNWFTWILKVSFLAPVRLFFAAKSRCETVKALKEADVVIFKGGHFYRSWSKNPIFDALALLIILYNIFLCIRLKKRFCLFSHSFGPFHSSLSKMIIRKTMQQASYLSCRESISKDILASCGIPPEKIDVICDAGFATYSCSQEKTSELLEKYNLSKSNYIAVTARPWFQKEISKGNRSHYDNYVKTMASLCDYLVHDKNKNIALIVQNDGAHSINEPDIVPLQDIFNKMSYSDSAIILDDDFTFDELTSLYENAFITIGTRLHSCIFSLSAATPAIAVAYAHKAQGIMTMLDASEFILDIENPSVSKGKGLIEKLSSEHDVLSEKYRKKTQILCDEIYSIMQKIISKNLNAKK